MGHYVRGWAGRQTSHDCPHSTKPRNVQELFGAPETGFHPRVVGAQVASPTLPPNVRPRVSMTRTSLMNSARSCASVRPAGQARGGVAAAAAFLQRAVALTVDPARRAERGLAAAQASLQAGAFDAALGLLATAEARLLDEFQRARVDLLRAYVAFASGLGSDAPPLLLEAARRLEPFDLRLVQPQEVLGRCLRRAVLPGQPVAAVEVQPQDRGERAELHPPVVEVVRQVLAASPAAGLTPGAETRVTCRRPSTDATTAA